jgi:hypothetical protein
MSAKYSVCQIDSQGGNSGLLGTLRSALFPPWTNVTNLCREKCHGWFVDQREKKFVQIQWSSVSQFLKINNIREAQVSSALTEMFWWIWLCIRRNGGLLNRSKRCWWINEDETLDDHLPLKRRYSSHVQRNIDEKISSSDDEFNWENLIEEVQLVESRVRLFLSRSTKFRDECLIDRLFL